MINLNFQKNSNYKESVFKLDEHFPYCKLSVYFDNENFLFSTYGELPGASACLILESHDGTVINVQNCNCGYGGAGPHNTQAILLYLGIPKQKAESMIWESGLCLEFDSSGKMIESSAKLGSVFESRISQVQRSQVYLQRDIMFANMKERQLFFVNPQKGYFQSLYNLIAEIQPREFVYYIGQNSKKYIDYEFPYGYERNKKLTFQLQTGPFAIIKSEQLDIVCLFDTDSAVSIINNLYMYFFQNPIFFETQIADITMFSKQPIRNSCFSKWSLIKKLLKWETAEDIYSAEKI